VIDEDEMRDHFRHVGLYALLMGALFLAGDPWLAVVGVLAVVLADVW